MFEIKHTLCPSCSVGCGINVILDGEEIVGTFPYKRHPVNAGKNCLNGRNSIDCFKDKLENVDLNKAIADASNEIKSANASDVTVICSGNDTVEEIEAIKDFAESNGFNIGFYANDLKNFDDVASYEEVHMQAKYL
jgi:formate dehydrogenase major subunit